MFITLFDFSKKQSSVIQVVRISRLKRVSTKKFDSNVMHAKLIYPEDLVYFKNNLICKQ